MKKNKFISILVLALLVISSVACESSYEQEVEQKIKNTADHFAPDSRVALFDVEAKESGGSWVLKGETNLPNAKAALMDSLSAVDASFTDSIQVLPSPELEGKTYALVNNSAANIRSRPSHPAQLVTQATMGMALRVLKKEGSWYYVQTPDDYLGWVDSGGLHTMTEEEFSNWKSAAKIIYQNTYGTVYEQPNANSPEVSDLVSGSILKSTGADGGYFKVSYPDGRTGYVSRSEARDFDEWKNSVEASEDRLVKRAESMKGAPYLWGGTSSKGMDCSGFTKTIYFMSGRIIPRDASQQVQAGKSIDTSEGFENLQRGDLLFFGSPATENSSRRVVHVGMWIGNNEFIHSAGRVKVSSVDPEADNYDEYNLNRYLETRRYLDNWEGNIIQTAEMYNLGEHKEAAEKGTENL